MCGRNEEFGMGLFGSKKKTKVEPWKPAQPYIIKGMQQTSETFDENQPRLQKMSKQAYDAFTNMAPTALAPSPFVTNAQNNATAISDGAFLGTNPGASTYTRLQRSAGGMPHGGSADPSMRMLTGMANAPTAGAGDASLYGMAAGGDVNPADRYASAAADGRYLNQQPSAGLYANMMGSDYLKGNPYLDQVISQTNADVAKNANRMFTARGMGSGVSSAFADMLSKNMANNEGQLRYQNYNDASARQLQAAGQSDAAWGGERGRMDASAGLLAANHNASQDRALNAAQALNQQGQQSAQTRLAAAQALGGQYNAGQDRALEAAKAADTSQSNQIQQMLTSIGMTGDLSNAQYAGVAPALNLLNAAADIPYVGVGALNGNIREASNGYNTTTTKTSGGLVGSLLGSATDAFGKSFGGGLGTAALAKFT